VSIFYDHIYDELVVEKSLYCLFLFTSLVVFFTNMIAENRFHLVQVLTGYIT
jgi:hypothetical protein